MSQPVPSILAFNKTFVLCFGQCLLISVFNDCYRYINAIIWFIAFEGFKIYPTLAYGHVGLIV